MFKHVKMLVIIMLIASLHGARAVIINGERSFVIVITGCDNIQILDSAVAQKYTNYKIVCEYSADIPSTCIEKYLAEHDAADKIMLIKNEKRTNSDLESQFFIINQYLQHDDIVVLLHGDCTLAHENVLNNLNKVYENTAVWMTYGQRCASQDAQNDRVGKFPIKVLRDGNVREYPLSGCRVGSFYAKLFRHIDKSDVQKNGVFLDAGGDRVLTYYMLELAGIHARYRSDLFRPVRNDQSRSSNLYLEEQEEVPIRAMKPLKPLSREKFLKNSGLKKAITYTFSGGRLGDNLLAYMHAKWLSYKYDIPLIYRPFAYADQFVFSSQEIQESLKEKTIKKMLVSEEELTIEPDKKTLFEVPYFPESPYELKTQKWPYFNIDWDDEQFVSLLKTLISPKKSLPSMILPSGKISVALHVRRGGSYEQFSADFPSKFPHDEFYIESLDRLYTMLGGRELYVFIFTDDRHPDKVAAKLRKFFKDKNIIFDYRTEENDHNLNVLEDFFALTQFDCLIRPDSNFSLCAAKLKKFLVEIAPEDCVLSQGVFSIATVSITANSSLAESLGYVPTGAERQGARLRLVVPVNKKNEDV